MATLMETVRSNQAWERRLQKLMMRDVTARYALLYKWGANDFFINNADLTGSPADCRASIYNRFVGCERNREDHIGLRVLNGILTEPLPEGIPE